MIRISIFIFFILLSIIFGWWMFLLICFWSLIYIDKPIELLIVGTIMDYNHYLGQNFFMNYLFFFISIMALFTSMVLQKMTNLKKVII